jgi:hypothetical protein
MTDKISSATIVCEGGLDSTQNHILLDTQFPGRATRLLNYETSLDGGYRRIDGFREYDADFRTVDSAGAEGAILGLAIFRDHSENDYIYTARKQQGSNTYRFYRYDPISGWVAQVTGFTQTSVGVTRIRHTTFIFGNKSYIIFVDGANFACVTDGTNWWQLKSTNAGGSGAPGGNQVIDSPAYVTLFKNHIFLSGDSTYRSVVAHSAPSDVFTWTSAAGSGQLVSGFRVMQIKPFRENLFVFGKSHISKISVDSTNFVINTVTTNIGCLSSDAVLEINGDIVFLAQDGLRPISGTNKIGDVMMEILSKQVQALVKDISGTYNHNRIVGGVLRNKSQIRIFATDGLQTGASAGIIGGLRNPDPQTGWEFGELSGFHPNVVENGYIGDREVFLHGDFAGNIMEQDAGTSFDGAAIVSIYATPFLTFGDSRVRKLLRNISTFYKAEGDFNINLQLEFDWGLDDILEPPNFIQSNTEAETAVYDVSDYDSGAVYGGGTTSPVIRTSINGSFFSVKFTFTTNDTNNSHSINGFLVELTQQERR